jgi:autotransporter-associated beta strand protein
MDNGVGADGTVQFTNTVGANDDLDVIDITGNLDLDGAISNTTSLSVSGTSNLGANVTTSSTQTYSGNTTISNNITLTTTNSNVSFGGSTTAGTAGNTLTIAAGTGDVTFTGAVGETAMGNTTITTGALSAAAIKVQGTLSITNSDTSTITGIISDGATSAILTKAGSGTLTLSGNNTYTGQTNINAGTLAVTVNNALGTNAAGTVIASGATLDLQNVTYSTTEAITNNGGTLSTSTGTSSFAGVMTLGANSTIDVDGTQLTVSTAIGDGSNGYDIDKTGNGILVLSGANSYTGDTTISAGTIKLTGSVNSLTDLIYCKWCNT